MKFWSFSRPVRPGFPCADFWLLAVVALRLGTAAALGADGVWVNGASNSTWSTTANWMDGQVADGTDAVAAFNVLDLAANRTVNLGGNRVVGTLLFGDVVASNNWTLANGTGGPWTLTLQSSVGIPTIGVENQATTISATLQGVQGFVKTGAGTLTLTGANTFTGGVTLTQGTLSVASAALGQNLVDITGTATVTWNGINTQDYSGQLRVQDGVTATLNVGANAVTFASPVQTGPGGTAVLVKAGAGTLTLLAANVYSGGTKVNAGRLVLAGGNDRLLPTGTVTLGQGVNGGTLQLGDANGASEQAVASITSIGTSGANAVVGGSEAMSTLTIANPTANTFSGKLGGFGPNEDQLALVKTGAGALTLSGANTFAGNVDIRSGAVVVTNVLALGSAAKTVTIGGTINAPSLQLNQATGISLPKELRLVTSNDSATAPAILSVAGNNAINGSMALAGGGFGNTQTRVTVNGGFLLLNGPITPADDAPSARTLILDGTASGAVTGVLANGGVPLAVTKAGAGTWALSAANTYTGATSISAGRLTVFSILPIGTAQPLGTAASAITIGSSAAVGTLEYAGAEDATLSRNVTVNGTAGAVLLNSGGLRLTLSGTLNKNARPLTFAGGEFTINGRITGGVSTTPLLVDGARVTLFNTSNSYGGTTGVINGGTLHLGNSEVLPDSTELILGEATANTGGSLELEGGMETIGGLSSAGTGESRITNAAASALARLRVTGAGNFGGRISDGPSAQTELELALAAGGEEWLTGDNSYTGPTIVTAGTLGVSGKLSGSMSLRVAAGTLLLGAANVLNDEAELSLQGGVFRAAGYSEGSADAHGLGALTLLASSTIDFGPGGGSVLSFAALGAHAGGSLSLLNWSGTPGTAGTAADDRLIFWGDPAEFTAAYAQAEVNFDGTSGYLVVPIDPQHYEVTAVPEPGAAALMGMGALALAWRRRRKSH